MTKRIIIPVILMLVLLAGVSIGRLMSDSNRQQQSAPETSRTQGVGNQAESSDIRSLVSYTLPDGWQDATCDATKDQAVYVLPQRVTLDCTAALPAPISLAIDSQNTTDCSQLDKQQNVRKHTCSSTDTDGHKTLKSSTEYTQSGGRTADETIVANYFDTGEKVVKLEYHYNGSATYQDGYDQIVRGIMIK